MGKSKKRATSFKRSISESSNDDKLNCLFKSSNDENNLIKNDLNFPKLATFDKNLTNETIIKKWIDFKETNFKKSDQSSGVKKPEINLSTKNELHKNESNDKFNNLINLIMKDDGKLMNKLIGKFDDNRLNNDSDKNTLNDNLFNYTTKELNNNNTKNLFDRLMDKSSSSEDFGLWPGFCTSKDNLLSNLESQNKKNDKKKTCFNCDLNLSNRNVIGKLVKCDSCGLSMKQTNDKNKKINSQNGTDENNFETFYSDQNNLSSNQLNIYSDQNDNEIFNSFNPYDYLPNLDDDDECSTIDANTKYDDNKKSTDSNLDKENKETEIEKKVCDNCLITESKLWNQLDNKTLCNACGIYYKVNDKHRPIKLINSSNLTNNSTNQTKPIMLYAVLSKDNNQMNNKMNNQMNNQLNNQISRSPTVPSKNKSNLLNDTCSWRGKYKNKKYLLNIPKYEPNKSFEEWIDDYESKMHQYLKNYTDLKYELPCYMPSNLLPILNIFPIENMTWRFYKLNLIKFFENNDYNSNRNSNRNQYKTYADYDNFKEFLIDQIDELMIKNDIDNSKNIKRLYDKLPVSFHNQLQFNYTHLYDICLKCIEIENYLNLNCDYCIHARTHQTIDCPKLIKIKQIIKTEFNQLKQLNEQNLDNELRNIFQEIDNENSNLLKDKLIKLTIKLIKNLFNIFGFKLIMIFLIIGLFLFFILNGSMIIFLMITILRLMNII